MKNSLFNIVLPYANLVVVYNTLWNSSVIIPQKTQAIWGINGDRIGNLELLDENKRNILINNHILVDDNLDEVELAQKEQYSTNHNPERYEITLIPTLGCNFRCWYCYEDHDRCDYMDKIDIESINNYVRQILTNYPQLKSLSIHFFGGEPLLRFNHIVVPLLEQIDKTVSGSGIRYDVTFTTNASLLNAEKIDFLKRYNTSFMQITIDGNKERHNKVRFAHVGDNSFDLIIRNIKFVLRQGIRVCVRINVSEDTHLDIDELLKSFEDLSSAERTLVYFYIYKVWQADKSVNEILFDLVEQIRKGGFSAGTVHSNPHSIWNSCYADKENHVIINPKGKVFKCTAREFSEDQIEGQLQKNGTVDWTELHKHRTTISVFNRPKCRQCSILPICAGGCSQRLIEQEDNQNFCAIGNEREIREFALNVFKEKLNSGEIGIIK